MLAGLVEQSLVIPEDDDAPRYRMLEPIRQYAAAKLEEAGEADTVADRAADCFADLAAAARAGLRAADQAEWLDRLDRDHDNLSSTLRRLIDRGDPGAAAQLTADTWLYWALRGHAVEGIGWMDRIRQDGDAALAPAGRAALHLALAGLSFAAGDVPGTASSATAAADAARTARADDLHAEALVLAANAAAFRGALNEAQAHLDEVEPVAQAHLWARAHTALSRSQLLIQAGDLTGGATVLAAAERAARELGNPFTLATVLNVQASFALGTADDDTALTKWAEAAALAAEVGTTWTLAYTVPGLAVLAARRGLDELAAELFAAGSATAEAASVAVVFPPDLAAAAQWLAAVREELGEDAFRRAWERGRGMRPDDIPGLAERLSDRS